MAIVSAYSARESSLIAQRRLLQPSHHLHVDTRPKVDRDVDFFFGRLLSLSYQQFDSAVGSAANRYDFTNTRRTSV